MVNDILCGCANFFTVFTLTAQSESTWEALLVSVVSTLLYSLVNIAVKIGTTVLQNKKLINAEQKKKIDDIADDLADDGKLNGSNHESEE